ncbi:hypothetical protein HWV62_16940 [Athelia sp. TMB]|nr:hypothetical protein HWV62_16940 [Athelia sp. TMB]
MSVSPAEDSEAMSMDDDRSTPSSVPASESLIDELRAKLAAKDAEFRQLGFISAQDNLRAQLLEGEMKTATQKISQLTQDQKFQNFAMSQLKNQIEGLKADLETREGRIGDLNERVDDLAGRLAVSERRRRRVTEQLEVQALDRIASEAALMRSLSAVAAEHPTASMRDALATFGSILGEDRRKTRAWLADDGRNSEWAVLEGEDDT